MLAFKDFKFNESTDYDIKEINGMKLPSDYLEFMHKHNGGEGNVAEVLFMQFVKLEELVDYNNVHKISKYFPNCFAFGGDFDKTYFCYNFTTNEYFAVHCLGDLEEGYCNAPSLYELIKNWVKLSYDKYYDKLKDTLKDIRERRDQKETRKKTRKEKRSFKQYTHDEHFYAAGRKKPRGSKRKLNALLKDIDRFNPFTGSDQDRELFLVPSSRWIDSRKISGKIKTAFIQKWLDKTAEFIKNKPSNLPFCKIVAMIDYVLWESEIIIFYSEECYKGFIGSYDRFPDWTLINDSKRSLAKKRNLKLSTNMKERGYDIFIKRFRVSGEFYKFDKFQYWYYGEL